MPSRSKAIEQLLENFQAIKRKLRAKSGVNTDETLREVTPAQWGVLRFVAQRKNVTTKDIAQQFDISSSAATQLIDALVGRKQLQRFENPEDRRSQHITLTARAKEQLTQMRKKQLITLSNIFSVLNDAELAEYLDLTAKLVRQKSLP